MWTLLWAIAFIWTAAYNVGMHIFWVCPFGTSRINLLSLPCPGTQLGKGNSTVYMRAGMSLVSKGSMTSCSLQGRAYDWQGRQTKYLSSLKAGNSRRNSGDIERLLYVSETKGGKEMYTEIAQGATEEC